MRIVLAALAAFTAFTAGTAYGNDVSQLKPCQYEDSVNCYWDASTRGNGRGRSFIADENGHVTYLGPAVDQVAAHNDGFADSKQDDCDQGFKFACEWLANNR